MDKQARHTPGPWEAEFDEVVSVRDSEGGRVCKLTNLRGPHGTLGRRDTSEVEANARRIVAAWNAVEGITTEALEAGVVRELVEIAHITRILMTDWLENSDCDCSVESARLHVCGRTEVEADLSRVDGLLSKLRGGTDA